MLEYSHGEMGWDVFTLEYRIDAPIDTVITPDGMINYMKLFNHIWKMRRVESSLTKSWMRMAGGARTFLKLPGKGSFPQQAVCPSTLSQNSNITGIRFVLPWRK
jgi:gamma-tubulin complex component 3